MQVRIYQPPKTAMQSGQGNTKKWVMEFEPESARRVEPLMGWTSSRDTKGQVRLRFDTADEAVAYARKHGLMYTLERPHERKHRPKAYADNFRYGRLGRWTH
ncbi:MAG: ETC complex I subunit [Kiloniellales bacterium]|nr:ETC complex I subunit [Kiloniellales bacterium]